MWRPSCLLKPITHHSSGNRFHLPLQQSVFRPVETGHGLRISTFVGVMLNSQLLMSMLHLLLCETTSQGQPKRLTSDNRLKVRVSSQRTLFTPMV